MGNFRFFMKNDGTEAYNVPVNHLLYERIQDLENHNERLQSSLNEANEIVQRLSSRAYPDIQRVRDEQHIDDYVAENFTNRNDFMMHIRRQQANRIVEKLLENNLIDHTFTRSDANNYSISRMEIRVQSPDV